jgi:hypothetical protein
VVSESIGIVKTRVEAMISGIQPRVSGRFFASSIARTLPLIGVDRA